MACGEKAAEIRSRATLFTGFNDSGGAALICQRSDIDDEALHITPITLHQIVPGYQPRCQHHGGNLAGRMQ